MNEAQLKKCLEYLEKVQSDILTHAENSSAKWMALMKIDEIWAILKSLPKK